MNPIKQDFWTIVKNKAGYIWPMKE
jgi:hypothetical protein